MDSVNHCTAQQGNVEPSWRLACEARYLAKLTEMSRNIELAHPNRAKRRAALEAEIARMEREK